MLLTLNVKKQKSCLSNNKIVSNRHKQHQTIPNTGDVARNVSTDFQPLAQRIQILKFLIFCTIVP